MNDFDPAVAKAMELISSEARRQGFWARQTDEGTWQFRKGGSNFLFQPTDALGVLRALSLLISAGLRWPHQG